MNDDSTVDALLEDVLGSWPIAQPPEHFAERVAASPPDPAMHTQPSPRMNRHLQPWAVPALAAFAAGLLIVIWLRAESPPPSSPSRPADAVAEQPAPEALPVLADPSAVSRAQLAKEWEAVSRAIEAANGKYPFGDGPDLDFAEFERLYAPGGLVDRFALGLARHETSGDETPVHPAVLEVLERTATLQTSLYSDGSAQFAFDVQLVDGVDSRQLALDVGGSVVRFRPGRETWEPLHYAEPNAMTRAVLTARGFATRTEIATSGPWAFFRLLDRAEDLGTPGDFAGPFVFDFSEQGLGSVTLRLDGDPRDERAAELRRLLMHPMPAVRTPWRVGPVNGWSDDVARE